NQQMPYHCVGRIERLLNEAGKPVRGSKIALLGVSYKPGSGDVRESPGLKIVSLLADRGADLRYHDPFVAHLPDHDLRSEPLDDALAGADLVVIVTAHPGVDHDAAVAQAPLALDLRGVTRRSGPAVRL
ncbi:MAG: UDP binding domain-containing protein, partial [Solirubrobacteraceae bacterium]